MKKLIADVKLGDVIRIDDDYRGYDVEVKSMEWDSMLPFVTINHEVVFAKTDWVEVK
ncbi:TPA: hypothetical protein LN609_003551 [Salmonella enterica subsp. enterica serovar Typhimurium]|nr:hypothetical protein [Salmonella enterica subsp. enterica serovar Typhimurium]HCR8473537.1 hypothetical protein [Shigella flexneri]HCR8479158.1 hypothetical protein [Shigella flexneri]